ncbi:acyl-CoA dehydrogenase family protein [Robiginitomaculum antarcticum]|uniref:acyl-CoA dehydrogenase family protein n=1 Tax=Robiginitomaculum antarcticum TaxID=437507 RepID=UPI00035FB2B8|nr:acyl-CoA dehydrogenase family protein [Robiginitomaculum antarcticum]
MALVLNEDEVTLRDTAEGFFANKAPVTALRKLRDARDETGFDRALWAEMADMGFAGVCVDEDHGGVDMGFMAAGLLAEQMGRNLSASPFLSTAILAATAIRHGGTAEQKAKWLSAISGGRAVMALALDEGAKHNPKGIQTRAETSGNGFKINGAKAMVVDGHVADQLIVAARMDDEQIGLFLVDPKTAGVDIERTIMVDSRNAARIDLKDVEVTGDARLSEGDDVLTKVMSAGRAVVAAELLGAGGAAFEMTVAYIKERKQFGKIIGEFQGLQHRASHLYSEYQLARSAVLASLTALDEGDENAAKYCAMAKAKLGSFAKLASQEGVQMHGGVGMTDEYDIGLYMKRIRVLQELLGDASYHFDQLATQSHY